MQLGYGWKSLGIMGLIIMGLALYGLSLGGESRIEILDSSLNFLKLWILLFLALLISRIYKIIRKYLHKKGVLNYQPIVEKNNEINSISIKRILKWFFIITGVPILILIIYTISGEV